MYEYASEAIVLDRDIHGESDVRVILFTREFGKLVARARSMRKILSKLAGHLEPGTHASVRLIEKKGLQVVDALKRGRSAWTPADLFLMSELLPQEEPAEEVWDMLAGDSPDWRAVLRALGWDPRDARCTSCEQEGPRIFHLKDPSFFCEACIPASVLADRRHAGKYLRLLPNGR